MTGDTSRPDLRAATLQGVRWISAARIVAETTALATSVVLARLIPPSEFGRAAVPLVVIALAAIVGPAGVTSPIVQRPSLERSHAESVAFLGLTSGATMTLLTILFGKFAGAPLFGEQTARLILLAAPAWLIVGIGGSSLAMLQRELRFQRIAIVDGTSVLAGAGTALSLALSGVDAAAIVTGGLVACATGTLLAVIFAPPARPRPDTRVLGEVGGFAASVSSSSFVYSLFRNVDYAILTARLPAAEVGYYWRAFQLGVDYQSKISQIMLRISFPVYSRTEGLEELRRLRMRIVRMHATVIVPLLAVFVASAPIAIPWLFGPVWEPVVLPAQIMAVAGVGDALTTGTGPLLVAIGRPGVLLAWNLCELAIYAVMILVLASHVPLTVSIGVASFSVAAVVVTQVALLRPLVRLPLRQFLREIAPGVAVGACLAVSLSGLRRALEEWAGLPDVIVLLVLGLAALAIYATLLHSLFPAAWGDLVSVVRRLSASQRASTADS